MKRREFITILSCAAVWPMAARAQSAGAMRRVGWLDIYREDDPAAQGSAEAVREDLAKAGWTVGRNLQIDYRWGITTPELAQRLGGRLATEPHTRLRYFCSPQHTDSAFYPIIGQMERAAGFAHDDSAQGRLDKLDALLAQTSTSAQDAALFAEMLSLPNDGRYPALAPSPVQRRQKTLEALTAQMQALSRKIRC
jgi:hypothetical protein